MVLNIKHNHSENNFSCRTGDTHAVVAYSRKHEALSIDRIFIPDEYKDSELQEQLIRRVFSYCKNQNLQVIANNPAIVEFIEKNQQFKPLLLEKPPASKGTGFLRL
ncbi:MAG: N-acetyltransferase [bacterium]